MAENIESHLVEKRVFKPAKNFAKGARIKSLEQYRRMYRESINRPEKFWAREASELVWQRRWKSVLKWKAPFTQCFGELPRPASHRADSQQGRDSLGRRAGR
jgi:acetyl-CoA synthetase